MLGIFFTTSASEVENSSTLFEKILQDKERLIELLDEKLNSLRQILEEVINDESISDKDKIAELKHMVNERKRVIRVRKMKDMSKRNRK